MSSNGKPLIVWSDPPPRCSGRELKYAPLISELKNRPGAWACVQRSENRKALEAFRAVVTAKNYRAIVAPGKLSVAVRKTKSGDYGAWMRYRE